MNDVMDSLAFAMDGGYLSGFLGFFIFSIFQQYRNTGHLIELHVYIWQVSLQLSYSDTCRLLRWFESFNIFRNN